MPRITDHAFVGSDLQPAHARDLCLVCDGKRDAHEREQPAREDCDRCGEHLLDCSCAERRERDAELDAFQAEDLS